MKRRRYQSCYPQIFEPFFNSWFMNLGQGELVVREGEFGEGLYIILKGKVCRVRFESNLMALC